MACCQSPQNGETSRETGVLPALSGNLPPDLLQPTFSPALSLTTVRPLATPVCPSASCLYVGDVTVRSTRFHWLSSDKWLNSSGQSASVIVTAWR